MLLRYRCLTSGDACYNVREIKGNKRKREKMTKDLTKGSPLKLIISFAIPVFFGMLFQQFYNIVDTLIVGRLLGVQPLAGVGSTGSINFLVIGFCIGVCAGFSIPIAQRFGAGDYSELRKYVANAMYLCGVFSVLLAATVCILCKSACT